MSSFKASHRFARVTARKARLVVDMIRGQPVNHALVSLERSPQRAAQLVHKLVRSAVANAEQGGASDLNQLRISKAWVDEGPLLGGYMRWRPAARGRAMPYRKKTSHIHVELSPAVTAGAASGTAES